MKDNGLPRLLIVSSVRKSEGRSVATRAVRFGHTNMGLRDDLEEARKTLRLTTTEFGEVRVHAHRKILENIWATFTKLGHEAERHWWINHHLEGDVVGLHPELEISFVAILRETLPENERLWLVGIENRNRHPKYWLYETTAEHLVKVLEETYAFDFYVCSKKYDWLVTQEHHGVILAVGEPVASKLKDLRPRFG
jgi:hypothetical protein